MIVRQPIDTAVPILNSVLLMCEQLQDALPHQRDPEYYIVPVLQWMRAEWGRAKRIIANNLVAAASVEKLGMSADEVFDAEDSVDDGGMSGASTVVPVSESIGTVYIPLLEAEKPKPGSLGVGQVRNDKGKLEDVFFDTFGEKEWQDMDDNWSGMRYKDVFRGYEEIPENYQLMSMKNKAGRIQGAMLYTVVEDGSVYIETLETASFNRGKKGLSGVGSNLLARVGLEVEPGKKLSLLSADEAVGFYEHIGMSKGKGKGIYQFTHDEAQSFAEKLGVSQTAKKVVAPEIQKVIFNPASKNAMYQQLRAVMNQYKVGTKKQISDAKRLARSDTIPTLMAGKPANRVQVMLSKEGMEEVVNGLKFQADFVDDLEKSTRKRVGQLMKGRYGDTASFRKQVNREFRIDRDATLADFHRAVREHAESMKAGRITPASFQARMEKTIHTHYTKLYRDGKGSPLEAWEKEFVKQQADSQSKYLGNFGNYITQQQGMGKELTGRITQRAALYAERGTSLFEAGHVSSFPDDILMDWLLQPAEHCPTCPRYAGNSPYTKETLPGYPGEGFHLTKCGTNCRCILRPSDLYVTELGEPSDKALAIKIVPPKPVPSTVQPIRTSKNTLTYKGKTYVRDPVPRGGKFIYTETVDSTGKTKEIERSKLPKQVNFAFRKKWEPDKVTKTITKPKPKRKREIPKAPKPQVKVKPIEPTEEIKEAMGKTKYDSPKVVRKKLKALEEKETLKQTLHNREKTYLMGMEEMGKDFNTYKELSADPGYKTLQKRREVVHAERMKLSEDIKKEARALVQTSSEGFKIKTFYPRTETGKFTKKAEDGVREFSKYIDKGFLSKHKELYGDVDIRDAGKGARASAKANRIELASNTKTDSVIHEMGHFFEHSQTEIYEAADAFLKRRTRGEMSISMNKAAKSKAYGSDEVTKKDKFIDPYMGKIYAGAIHPFTGKVIKGTRSTEIISMGIEEMYLDPVRFARRDSDMFDFIYNICRGIF